MQRTPLAFGSVRTQKFLGETSVIVKRFPTGTMDWPHASQRLR